jgi:hypothetical protein
VETAGVAPSVQAGSLPSAHAKEPSCRRIAAAPPSQPGVEPAEGVVAGPARCGARPARRTAPRLRVCGVTRRWACVHERAPRLGCAARWRQAAWIATGLAAVVEPPVGAEAPAGLVAAPVGLVAAPPALMRPAALRACAAPALAAVPAASAGTSARMAAMRRGGGSGLKVLGDVRGAGHVCHRRPAVSTQAPVRARGRASRGARHGPAAARRRLGASAPIRTTVPSGAPSSLLSPSRTGGVRPCP